MELQVIQPLNSNKFYETCISVSLFKMNPLQVYRDFSKYVNKFMDWVNYVPKTAFVRLYVDAPVLQDESFKRVTNKHISHLEIIQFKYAPFMDNDGYHDGTFGSVIRFLPLFDEKLKAKYVWISDTDMTKSKFTNFYISEMKRQKAPISYVSSKCYFRDWIFLPDFPIVNYRLIVDVKFISKSREQIKANFFEFIRDVLSDKYSDIKNKIISYQVSSGKKTGAEFVKYFPYGFDELYSNEILLPVLSKYKRLINLDFNFGIFDKFLSESQIKKSLKIRTIFWYNKPTKKYLQDTVKFYTKIADILKPFITDEASKKCLQSFYVHKNKIRYTESGDFMAFFTV